MADATVTSVAAIAAGKAPPTNSLVSMVVNVPAASAVGDCVPPVVTGGAGSGGATVTAAPAVAAGKAVAAALSGGTINALPARATGKATAPFIPALPVTYDVRSVSTVTGTSSSFTLNVPAGATPTDAVYVCLVHSDNVQIEANDPTQGWSLATASAFAGNITVRILQTTSLATSGPWTFDFFRGGAPFADTYVAAAVCVTADSSLPGALRPVPDSNAATVSVTTTGPFVFPVINPTNSGDVVLYVGGWGRHTTLLPPVGTAERVDLSSGTSSTDKHLWIGSQNSATTAGTPTSALSVTNENPGSFAGAQQAMITVGLMSIAPPTTWTGDFETGDFSQYTWYQGAFSDRITIQTDTPHQGTKYARFTADNDDVYPLTPTENPRAQLVSPRVLFPGTERWISWSTRFAADFPEVQPDPGFLVFWQYHGPPYSGSPSVGFGVTGNFMNIERNVSYNFDTIWTVPLVRSQWIDFVLHVNLAMDETGFIELWMNGIQQIFKGGVRRLHMRTVEFDQNSGLEINPTNYRRRGMFETCTIDHDGVRMDTTMPSAMNYASKVAPPISAYGDGTIGPVRARVTA